MSDSVIPWTAAHQASPSITNAQRLLKLRSTESVMSSNHLILCHPLLLLPSVFPNIRVFSNKSALCIRWPKYWSFSFNISPSNEYSRLVSFRDSKIFLHLTIQLYDSCLFLHRVCVCTQLCLTFGDPMDSSLPGSFVLGIFPSKNTGVGCHFLLWGILLT